MNPQPDPIINGLLLAVCLFAILLFSSLFVGCQSAPKAPDPALFPDKAKEYNDGYDAGFKKGFHEGLVYNLLSQ